MNLLLQSERKVVHFTRTCDSLILIKIWINGRVEEGELSFQVTGTLKKIFVRVHVILTSFYFVFKSQVLVNIINRHWHSCLMSTLVTSPKKRSESCLGNAASHQS
jgi:hypothetical protein